MGFTVIQKRRRFFPVPNGKDARDYTNGPGYKTHAEAWAFGEAWYGRA